ncbi:MAG: ATP-binding cassette domain-containing protein, partial [Reyranella sp.]
MSDLLAIQNLVVEYPVGGGRHVHAVSDVTLSVKQGETLGLVGESGSGKSSLARALLQLPPPKAGAVLFDGQDLTKMRGQALRAVRPRLQMIFQDPIASLNPR